MHSLRWRLRASTIHLAISLLVATLAALLVFGLLYTFPYRELSGGRELFLWVVLVDVVLGPLITLVIFDRTKTPRHLLMDFTVVGLLQLAALSYGIWAVFTARPIHLVFEYHRMAVVHAVDVDLATLTQAPAELQSSPLTGPTLLSLRSFKSANESYNSTILALAGIPQAAQPALWQSYEIARGDILKESKSVTELKERFPAQSHIIEHAINLTGRHPDTLRSLPLIARKTAWTVLIDAETALPVGFVPIDSF
ncbi:MAG: TfpX/TfpZ family type IV pilin accessory protein [Comamonas sp.]